MLGRSTFCFPDSTFEPTAMGTADRFDLLPLVASFDARMHANAVDPTDGGVLDDYVEAHVHGTVELGRRLLVEDLAERPDFRGPRIVDVGHRVAVAGVLDAAVIGRAALAGGEDPQDLKKLWHCVAAHGTPTAS